MSKQIKAVASGIAALGRGEDKVLVHMTPREVAGLQALAVASGGSLTVNPKTGLPEAGWLSSLLPMVAAGAATFLSGGTLSPWLAALYGAGAGGVGAKVEGEDPLMGAVGGALGGLGGSGLTSGLMNAGRAGQVAAGTGTVLKDAGATAAKTAAQGTGDFAKAAAQNLTNPSFAQSPALNTIANAQQAGLPAVSTMGNSEAFQAGLRGLADKGAVSSLWGGLSNPAKAGVTVAGLGALDAATEPSSSKGKKQKTEYYHYTGNIDPVTGITTFGPGFRSREYDATNRGMYDPNNVIPDMPYYKKAGDAYADGGGVASLPRYVQGPGDGVSDGIPAVIDNNQPAALSNGEFVIDAQTVSKLGNGSSDAGAQRLYAMMDRVHRARTAPGQGIDVNKYLPA